MEASRRKTWSSIPAVLAWWTTSGGGGTERLKPDRGGKMWISGASMCVEQCICFENGKTVRKGGQKPYPGDSAS